ncbi:MAG: 2Fe-2S iron-sulfur cluster binding domain-containing protein [Spirochaeta sp.]|nr:2Fe-2S iron-sulfur cluster binding domain-containing protein [Spirochaeta sp.]
MFPITTLLISVGAISGLAAFLAVLMVIADATIGNYGEVTITINEQKKLTAQGGRPLLSTLMSEGIFIPSACGGRGSCGLCKVKGVNGFGQYLPTELPWISPEEREQNIRLSCQIKVKNDLEISIPEELFNVREYRTQVSKLRDLTYDIKEVTLKLAGSEKISFRAGQFIQFEVPAYSLSDEPVYRAYSIASGPVSEGEVELEIRLVPNGICTTYVHKYLKEGEKVIINGPYGDFFLRDTDRDIIFIAGGSGMAPIKSILSDMVERGNTRKITYYFGARTRADLFLVAEMEALEEKLANFSFVPALSAPEEDDNWKGETGLITETLAKHLSSGDNVEAYLCGSPGMIDACIKVLKTGGVPEEFIYYDKFA